MTNDYRDYLQHHGVKGMKWGVRRRPEGVSRRTNRAARKDAKEFARAKMFYGEGAGTRRKLIKAKVNSRSKKDPSYEKAFNYHLDNQDMGRHAEKARSERRRKNMASGAKRTARGVKNQFYRVGAPTTLTSIAIYTAYKNPVVRSYVNKMAYITLKEMSAQYSKAKPGIEYFMRNFSRGF